MIGPVIVFVFGGVTATGPTALALAAVITQQSPLVRAFDRRIIARPAKALLVELQPIEVGGLQEDRSGLKRSCMLLLRNDDAARDVQGVVVSHLRDIYHAGMPGT